VHPDTNRRMLELITNDDAIRSMQRQLAAIAKIAESAAVPLIRMSELAEVMAGALKPALLQQAVLQEAIAPALAAQAAQVAGIVRFSDVLRVQRDSILAILDNPGLKRMLCVFASSAALASVHDRIEDTDPDVLDAEIDGPDRDPEVGDEFGHFVQKLVEQISQAMTDRNAVTATVYVIVLAKCIELALIASAPLSLLALIVGGSGYAVARTAARAAGAVVDRLGDRATADLGAN
jgi:hypothetical protein